jgi:2-hydroxy-3-keto-5-methylthiopentenyl-1-phosphate phosphatase
MHRPFAPALFFDFDNTITLGDVLDAVIERFSVNEAWREWETEWKEGRMSTPECLRRQLGNLRVSRGELDAFMSGVDVDQAFRRIVTWAETQGAELCVLSDNFTPFIRAILEHQGLRKICVFANEFDEIDGIFHARFPFSDPSCARCAHCKAQHLRARQGRQRIFVGDGLSDVCAALVADVVFAKDSLATTLLQRDVHFLPYRNLDDVLTYLEGFRGVPEMCSP